MYSLEVRESVDRIFSKLAKKNPKQMRIIEKKIKQICEKPSHFKPLRAPMQHLRRVHIDKSFVLTYSIDEQNKVVIIEDYDHHDKVYL
ncbi:MAG: type II toxin-antitoxin system mRNA interferase toxin, RelE/StbE family [Euryarchaeota archaeon]|nr:type II toxin-antitoxin system mRNA interferase toxin, RelE/StbE family [Euryarchaeota archaeon]MBU4339663.1 type II toxin-antitoxin system mRNA interferase toxin, RelE/StbE family [Euryarchaeota archaeon]MCG2737267.1 type II toxin-antitoxin system mRNA interferase toxin, RelE/StbE family [Candidatus Methanoperedenaceae archaeon]